MTATPDVHTARRRFVLVGIVAPVVLTAIAVLLMLLWLPEMPSTVATHWAADGRPDRFAPAWTVPVTTAALGSGITALFATIVLVSSRDGEWGPTMRLLGAITLGSTALVAVGTTWSFGMQRGLDDAQDAPGVLTPLAVGFAAGLVGGIVGWFAQPGVVTSGGSHGAMRTVDGLSLVPGERAVWVRTTTMSRTAMIGIIAAIVALVLASIALAATGGPTWGIMLAVALVLIVVACATFVFRVRVDRAGLTVRSPIGAPRFRIPLADIDTVGVTTLQPLAEFGGWGLRMGLDGRFGVVLHSGEALQVVRRDGRVFVVTVDDAATAAALLEALTASERAQSAG